MVDGVSDGKRRFRNASRRRSKHLRGREFYVGDETLLGPAEL